MSTGKPKKLRWTSIPSRESRNTPSRFMLQKQGISSDSYESVGSKASFALNGNTVIMYYRNKSIQSEHSSPGALSSFLIEFYILLRRCSS